MDDKVRQDILLFRVTRAERGVKSRKEEMGENTAKEAQYQPGGQRDKLQHTPCLSPGIFLCKYAEYNTQNFWFKGLVNLARDCRDALLYDKTRTGGRGYTVGSDSSSAL